MKNKIVVLLLSFLSTFAFGQAAKPTTAIHVSIKRVLILGNSITFSGMDKKNGWSGNWGMAASTADSDYVHRLEKNIANKRTGVTVDARNIREFELNFATYDMSKLDTLRNPDLLIMRIGENVNLKLAEDNFLFIKYYDALITRLHPKIVIITNSFWGKPLNNILKQYAKSKNYRFIGIDDISEDKSNTAFGLFEIRGVAAHPGDKGMRLIANRIWSSISGLF